MKHARLETVALSATVMVCVLVSGCSKSPGPTPVRATDFVSAGGPPPAADPAISTAPRAPARVVSLPQARGEVDDVVVIAGSPSLLDRQPEPSLGAGSPGITLGAAGPGVARPDQVPAERHAGPPVDPKLVQVDQMVGQVNGRPIFAEQFFEPMHARLSREAQRMDQREWLAMVREDIQRALVDQMRDELLLAEFESSLTPEQKQGVLAFIQNVRADLISGNLGSEGIANSRLLEAEGLDLNQKVRDVTQRQFILAQLRKAIGSRVHISFWDVQRYYERNLDQFLPPPVARYRVIRVRASETEAVDRVTTRLDSGDSFTEIASEESSFNTQGDNLLEITLESRTLADARVFGPDSLNDAALALSPGDVSPPVEVGTQVFWLRLEEIHQPEGESLYEAQTGIESMLRSQRLQEEEIRYFSELFRRGSFTELDSMMARLLEFAAERYLIQAPTAETTARRPSG